MLLNTVGRRILIAIPTLVALTFVVFLLVKAVPGDPAQLMLGERANPTALAELRAELGLDQPWYKQYGHFLEQLVLHGDLGVSLASGEPIGQIIAVKFPATIELALTGMVFAIVVGLPLGLLAAVKPGSMLDFIGMTIAICGVSMPIFWLALLLTYIFGLELGWLPLSGRLGIEFFYEAKSGFVMFDALRDGDTAMLADAAKHLILPGVALGTIPMAFIARITRSSMLEVTQQDYVRTARAKGVGKLTVYGKHALKNAFIPILTVLGLQFGLLLGGAIITETIFSWPGIGSWLLHSVEARDYPAIQGGILVTATAFVGVNLMVDICYRLFDPRLRVG